MKPGQSALFLSPALLRAEKQQLRDLHARLCQALLDEDFEVATPVPLHSFPLLSHPPTLHPRLCYTTLNMPGSGAEPLLVALRRVQPAAGDPPYEALTGLAL